MQKKKKEKENMWGSEMISVFQGAIMTIVFAVGLLLLGAGLVGSGRISENRIDSLVYIVCALSALFAGVIQKSRIGHWTLLNGLLSAMTVCLLLAGLGILIWKKVSLEEGKNIVVSCLCGGGMAGILLGKRRKKRRA